MSALEASRTYGVSSSRLYATVRKADTPPLGDSMNRTKRRKMNYDESQENIVKPISSSESESASPIEAPWNK